MRSSCQAAGLRFRNARRCIDCASSSRSRARCCATRPLRGRRRARSGNARVHACHLLRSNPSSAAAVSTRKSFSREPIPSRSAWRRGSLAEKSVWTHSACTCRSRSAPSLRNSLRDSRLISRQAGSESTSATPEAMDRQRRSATRRSCTESAEKLRWTCVHCFSTRCIQCRRPECLASIKATCGWALIVSLAFPEGVEASSLRWGHKGDKSLCGKPRCRPSRRLGIVDRQGSRTDFTWSFHNSWKSRTVAGPCPA